MSAGCAVAVAETSGERRGTRRTSLSAPLLRNCAVDEERERPPDPGGPSGEGAHPGEPDYHLHTELGEETKRLATHPREEAHRLVEELREGETETTPLIALSGVLVAIVIALVFLIARLAS
jgi:hypothetical protein